MEEKELLPCPWCGEAGAAYPAEFLETTEPHCIYCPNDKCVVQPCSDSFDEQDQAIAAWNTRADQQQITIDVRGSAHVSPRTTPSDLSEKLKDPAFAIIYLQVALDIDREEFELACRDVVEAVWGK